MAALADPGEVRAHLVAAAQAGTALTYGELLQQLGFAFSRPKMRQLCVILAEVDAEAAGRGEPELAALVVRQSDRVPGQGWWVAGGARNRGYDGPWEGSEAERFIAAIQAEAFKFWQCRSDTESGERSD